MTDPTISAKRNGSASTFAMPQSLITEVHLLSEHTYISQRELEVLQLIAEGYRAKEIADQLFISIHTVASHKVNIMTKLKATNIASMVSIGFRMGLLK